MEISQLREMQDKAEQRWHISFFFIEHSQALSEFWQKLSILTEVNSVALSAIGKIGAGPSA